MDSSAAIIIAEAGPPEGDCPPHQWRFGERDAMAMVVDAAREVLDATVVVSRGQPIPPRYALRFLRGVTLPPALPAGAPMDEVLAAGLKALPGDISRIALLPAASPYLTGEALRSLVASIPADKAGAWWVEGEAAPGWAGAFRREAVEQWTSSLDGAPPGEREGAGAMVRVVAPPAPCCGATPATRLDTPNSYRRALAHLDFCDPAHPAVTLELYGTLRIKTGFGRVPLRGDSVAGACAALRRIFPEAEKLLPLTDRLPDHFRFAVNGGAVTTELTHPLREGDHLVLFSATVGG